jgi:hypothetical protein
MIWSLIIKELQWEGGIFFLSQYDCTCFICQQSVPIQM